MRADTEIEFLLSKHPYGRENGETRISRTLLEAAAEVYPVHALALTEARENVGAARPGGIKVTPLPKPAVNPLRLLGWSLARRRSLIHTRFSTPELVEALRQSRATVLLSRRTYMAQAVLDANEHLDAAARRLLVLADVLESNVMRERRSLVGPALRWEAARTWRDEQRCLRAAASILCVSEFERARLGDAGIDTDGRLDLVLPPASPVSLQSRPVALFLGDRSWRPNQEGLDHLLGLWPEIRRTVPEAELLVAGRGAASAGEGVRSLGYVDDLDEVWESTRVLIAPLRVGGGVRVKVLEAASRGIPVVASREALGSIGDYLPLEPASSDEQFVARAASLLVDRARAEDEGERLFSANRDLSKSGFTQRQLERWLGGTARPSLAPDPE